MFPASAANVNNVDTDRAEKSAAIVDNVDNAGIPIPMQLKTVNGITPRRGLSVFCLMPRLIALKILIKGTK